MSWLLLRLMTLCALATVLVQEAQAEDVLEDFRAARPALQQQLRSKQSIDRIEALRRLQEFPIADAVRLMQNSLRDPAEEVHRAAYKSLAEMTGNQEVCDTLMQGAKKALLRKDDGQATAQLLSLLLTSDLPSVQRDTNEFLEKSVVGGRPGVPVVIALADELGNHQAEADVERLLQLSKTRPYETYFGLRRAVVRSLTRIPTRSAVGALIGLMQDLHGEVQADAVEHLTQVTGQIFGMDSAAWARWWEENKDTFQHPSLSAHTPYRSVAMKGEGSYYGLPIFAERVVFVIDTSGSMTGERIMAAKRELIYAITRLSGGASFSIVAFNAGVHPWHKQLVPANLLAKQEAVAWVTNLPTGANTASYDALEAALSFDTEAIYFMSDGAPHGGKITAPIDIVRAITAINRSRRVSLYTIGIGVGFSGGPLDVFLKTLAEQNLGVYRRVDQ